MKQFLAIFDWDKTIRKDYVIFDFINVLAQNNIIDKSIISKNDLRLAEYTKGYITDSEFRRDVVQDYRKIY